jgi:hypothetical protein
MALSSNIHHILCHLLKRVQYIFHVIVFAVGAYETDNVAILRVNPVVSMETIMYVRPTIITASMPYLDLSTCFKYTGNAANLQSTLGKPLFYYVLFSFLWRNSTEVQKPKTIKLKKSYIDQLAHLKLNNMKRMVKKYI